MQPPPSQPSRPRRSSPEEPLRQTILALDTPAGPPARSETAPGFPADPPASPAGERAVRPGVSGLPHSAPGVDLDTAVARAFAEPQADPLETPGPPDISGPLPPAAPVAPAEEFMPSRMLNEFIYCPRLFYYEYVEGVFVENADTERGSALHEKVDSGKGELLAAKKRRKKPKADEPVADDDNPAEDQEAGDEPKPETIHSRSAMLSSPRLGVVAKMDLIEVRLAPAAADESTPREAASVTPVDYKAGAPRAGADANELWDADKMQLGLQILILRDNGYECSDGVIYYRATRQRVGLTMTPELEAWIIDGIARARVTALGSIPPPLSGSPKCVRCSLAPVCLPDETRFLAATGGSPDPRENTAGIATAAKPAPPRRLIAARDEARALYLNTQGVRIGRKDEVLVVKENDRTLEEVRAGDVTHVALFGNIQITTQALQMLCDLEIPVAYFSMGGWFYGLTRGHGMKNVFTRIEQFRAAGDPLRCLPLARAFVHGKIRNHRTMLMRSHVEPPAPALARLKQAAQDVLGAGSLSELLGMEGAAAALYFQHFGGMIKTSSIDDEDLPGVESTAPKAPPVFTFDFTRRTRRPPTDPVNALLSLAYSLLAKDCTIAALATGFDPYVGFYHQPRYGKPALALDLMEEFRPLIAESTVLTAISNRMLHGGHFVRAGDAVNLTSAGRKIFFQAYEQRMNSLITHPVFDYRVSYRRVLELQARLLAAHLTGEIPAYQPMVTR